MRTLLSEWTFHKAGQGCFYTGLINAHGRDKFCFVFDCGSTKGAAILREEIREFKSSLAKIGKTEIDLLVLSHYDADHVNQLPSLLRDTRCKIAVLPYLTNGERLNVYFSQGYSDATDDDDYFRFIADPAGYLGELNVERIIFIDGNDEEAEGGVGNNSGPPTGFRFNFFPNEERSQRGGDDISLEAEVDLKPGWHENDPEKKEFLQLAGTNAEFAKGRGSIRSGTYWEFFFHEKPQPEAMIWRFRERLRKVFKMELTGDYLSHEELVEMTRNAKARATLKRNHIEFFGDTNDSGLVVMHGPLGQRHTESFRKKWLYSGKYCSTLLNGDCNLALVDYPLYIKSALPWVRFFQVPHHGSRYSWDGLYDLDDLEPAHMIVNYGNDNKHKHPHKEVVMLIRANHPYWRLKRNTELKKYKYHITSYI